MRKFYLVGIVFFMATMFSCGDDDGGVSISSTNLSGTWDLYKNVYTQNGKSKEFIFNCEQMQNRMKDHPSGDCSRSGGWNIGGFRMQFSKNELKLFDLDIDNKCVVCDKEQWNFEYNTSYAYEVSGNKVLLFQNHSSQNIEFEIISLTNNELRIKVPKGEQYFKRK